MRQGPRSPRGPQFVGIHFHGQISQYAGNGQGEGHYRHHGNGSVRIPCRHLREGMNDHAQIPSVDGMYRGRPLLGP